MPFQGETLEIKTAFLKVESIGGGEGEEYCGWGGKVREGEYWGGRRSILGGKEREEYCGWRWKEGGYCWWGREGEGEYHSAHQQAPDLTVPNEPSSGGSQSACERGAGSVLMHAPF